MGEGMGMHVDDTDYDILQETAETVVSYMEDAHDIPIGVPDFLGSYGEMGVGMKYIDPGTYQENGREVFDDREERRQEYGAIKVVGEPRTAFGRLTDVAHELGHAALYQNTDFAALKDDPSVDETICKGISEAAAYDVERRVKRHHFRDNVVNPVTLASSALPYTLTKARYRLEDSFEDPAEPHALGRRILHAHGPVLEDAINGLPQLYDDVVSTLADQPVVPPVTSQASGSTAD
jgi:hypothetical protein